MARRSLVDAEPSAEQAFIRRLPELLALSAKAVLRINLDLPSVVATTLGALPRLMALRQDFERVFRAFDFAQLDALEDYALTLQHTHTEYLVTTQPVRCPPASLQEARSLRAALLQYLLALARRGLVDPAKWKRLHGPVGYANLATDLGMLAGIFRGVPALHEEPLLVTSAQLERATELSREILTVAGKREGRSRAIAAAADLRARAFTILIQTYDEIRHCVFFVRREEGDADEIAPSLFGGREVHRTPGVPKRNGETQHKDAAGAPPSSNRGDPGSSDPNIH
jgi:hypothetical protein